jgi:hypothetical protein
MLVYPDIPREWENVDRPPDMAAAMAADAVFDRLATIAPQTMGARIPFDDGVPTLGFDDEAQTLFDKWRANLEKSLRQSDRPPALESHISKYRKLVPALALLDHLIVGTSGDIQIASLKRAIYWHKFLLAHAKRAYAAVTSASMDSAKALSIRIQRGTISDGFSIRDLHRKGWSMLATQRETEDAVAILIDLGWLRAVPDVRQNTSGGRPTVRYYINPRVKRAA